MKDFDPVPSKTYLYVAFSVNSSIIITFFPEKSQPIIGSVGDRTPTRDPTSSRLNSMKVSSRVAADDRPSVCLLTP
jgi:hypothetical protein